MEIQSVEMAIYNESPSLIKIAKEIGDPFLMSFLGLTLIDLSNSFNIGKGLSNQQILWLCKEIKKDYYFLKPTELKLCFDNAKKGKYGKLYDRLDAMIIYEWIDMYLAERTSVIIKKNENDKFENQKSFDNIILPVLKNIVNEIKKPEEETVRAKEKLPHYDFHQKCMKSFDLVRKNFADSSGRYIKRFGRMINIEEFVEIKAEQLIRITKLLNKRNTDIL